MPLQLSSGARGLPYTVSESWVNRSLQWSEAPRLSVHAFSRQPDGGRPHSHPALHKIKKPSRVTGRLWPCCKPRRSLFTWKFSHGRDALCLAIADVWLPALDLSLSSNHSRGHNLCQHPLPCSLRSVYAPCPVPAAFITLPVPYREYSTVLYHDHARNPEMSCMRCYHNAPTGKRLAFYRYLFTNNLASCSADSLVHLCRRRPRSSSPHTPCTTHNPNRPMRCSHIK